MKDVFTCKFKDDYSLKMTVVGRKIVRIRQTLIM